MPAVSIIIPAYNAETGIERCVRSILDQEYKDLEVLVVDDGSKDLTGEILDNIAEEDARVVVIHKENGGVSAARNTAIKQAKGKYIQFSDADDWMAKEATKLLVRTMEEKQCDMVVADFYRVVKDNVSRKGNISQEKPMTRQEYAEYMMESPADYYYGVLWNKLYKKEIIDTYNICMDESLQWCEDFVFNLEYVLHADTIAALPVPVYYYVKTEGSLVAKNLSLTKIVQMKTSMFSYYNNFYKNVLDEKTYRAERMNIARFLIDAAGDDMTIPLVPGTKKLGEENIPVFYQSDVNSLPVTVYYLQKAYDRHFQSIALKYEMSLLEVKILFCVTESHQVSSQKDIADFIGVSQLSVFNSLTKMAMKNYIAFSVEDGKYHIAAAAHAKPIVDDIHNAEKDVMDLMLKDFSEEEKQQIQKMTERINCNLKNSL